MGNPEDKAHEPENGPSFDDPKDPRWSHNPQAAPPRNPYLDMPLDAPPVGLGNGGAGQSGQNPYPRPGYPQQGQAQAGYPQTGYPQPGYPVQAQRPSGVLSIVSLVTGIIGLFSIGLLFFPQLAAIICGHLALRREPHMRGVAIAGLVTGYLGAVAFVLWMVAVIILGSTMASYDY
ncbi:DUF4190 domain-containing protein [Paeniglutamicibacter sp. MACA_103]|uniref:DUF4190 domain-containing protein n=1 Tax=Paeniglutamicibacter sp. MACA_103 TaxID=3377337 RepID=UPI0038966B1D